MSGENANGAGDALTRDQLQALADDMTMGDIWRASKATDDRAELGMRAFWNAAKRTEIVGQDVDFESFIDRVRQDDFQAVNQARIEGKEQATTP
jgi:hypothetical protein